MCETFLIKNLYIENVFCFTWLMYQNEWYNMTNDKYIFKGYVMGWDTGEKNEQAHDI